VSVVVEPVNKDKLMKLLRLVLFTDKTGERESAALAIRRTLEGTGHDAHDLVDLIGGKIIEVIKTVTKVEVLERVVEVDRTQQDWIQGCTELLKIKGLSDWEREFLQDMKRRFELKPQFEPSQKQANCFARIYKQFIKQSD
jgi:hypothetical protein